MVKMIVLLAFGVIAHSARAQQKQLDSLLNLLSHHAREDTVRLTILNQIAYYYTDINPRKGLQAADQALTLALKLHDKTNVARAYGNKGMNYKSLSNDTLAAGMFGQSLKLFRQLNDKREMAVVLYNIGEIYFNRSDNYKALEYLERSLALFEPSDKKKIANALNATGIVYYSLSDYTKALGYYFKALRIHDQSGDTATAANVLGNIGAVYQVLREFSKALHYHQKSLALYKHNGNRIGIANQLEGIATVYDNLGDTSKALEFYNSALQINREMDNKRAVAINFTNIGLVYYYSGDYIKAMEYFTKAINLYRALGDKNNLATLLNIVADTYANAPRKSFLQWGINPENRYLLSVSYNKQALELARQAGSLQIQGEVLASLGNVYEMKKDYAGALSAFKESIEVQDSILNDKKKQEITRQEMRYEFDKKQALTKAENDKKQALAAAEIRRQQTVKKGIIAGAALLLVASLFSFNFYKRRRDGEVHRKEAEFKARVSEVEMKALRSQMNPHFIFNSLHSINKYVMDNDKEKASDYLSKFSKLMRLILENSREQEVLLEKDLFALELYIQLELLRFQNRFSYVIEVDPQIDEENTLIPPLLLQPFVENSIIHGLRNKENGLIKIKVNKEGDMIHCIVEDNGMGREQQPSSEPAEGKQRESLGMKITRERLQIINHLKKLKGAINIFDVKDAENKTGGVRIELLLPFEQAF